MAMNKRRRVYLPLFTGFVICLLTFFISNAIAMSNISKTANDTIDYAKKQVTSYDEYLDVNKTKSETRLIGKSIEFVDRYHSSSDLSWIEDYLKVQHITGISIVDRDYKVLVQYGKELPEGTISLNKNIDAIFDYPTKIFASNYEKNGMAYDVVALFFEEDKLAIVNYCKDILDSDDNLSYLFDGFNFNYDGIMAVAKDSTVIATSGKGDYSPLVFKFNSYENLDSVINDHGFIYLRMDGTSWFGICNRTSTYDYYVFYPSKTVNLARFSAPFIVGLLLLVVYYLATLSKHKKEVLNLEKERKQMSIIESISSIYYCAIFIDVNKNTYEFVNDKGNIAGFYNGISDADKMLCKMLDSFYAGKRNDEYHEFLDFRHCEKVLKNQPYVTKTFKHVAHWFDVTCFPLRNDNGVIDKVIYLWLDKTSEKEKEMDYNKRLVNALDQEKRANATKTSFLRRMSHDIRTPINGIRGLVKIAQDNEDNKEKIDDCLNKIYESSGFLLSLVNDVLDMNKLESGEITLDHNPFKLDKIINNAIDITKVRANERDITITSDIRIEYNDLIGSPLHLAQIFQNIINNAVKYNHKEGSINITLSEVLCPGNKVLLKFECADTGIGMSNEFQENVFKPFAQEGNTARGTYEGTGLGMAITKELVDKMGGSIGFSSVVDKGTTFVVELPFDLGESVEEEAEEENYGVSGLHVLVVEDNEINREIATFMLESVGIVPTCAINGKEALDKVKEGAYDCILMDVMMPVMGGLEATRQLRAMGIEIPIIAMSANAFKDDVERSLNAGMNAHLSKPIDEKLLVKTIYKFCKK